MTRAVISDGGDFGFSYFSTDPALVIHDVAGISMRSPDGNHELTIINSGLVTNIAGGADMMITDGVLSLAYTGGAVTVGGGVAASELRFLEPSGSGTNYIGFKAQEMTADTVYIFPDAFPAGNNYLLGSSITGALTWQDPAMIADGNGIYSGSGSVPGGIALLDSLAQFDFQYNNTTPAISIIDQTGIEFYSNSGSGYIWIYNGNIQMGTGSGHQMTQSTTNTYIQTPYLRIDSNTAGNPGIIRFDEPSGTDYVSLQSPSLVSSTAYTFPNAYPGGNGYVLTSTTAGV